METKKILPFAKGSGPGVQSPDGCSVEAYKLQPYLGELDDVLTLLPTQATVLELGCGTGRLTQVLVEQGHQVTVVDNCNDMLHAISLQVDKHYCDIASLELGKTFDAVILASSLINVPDTDIRHGFLKRHLRPNGFLYAERHDPQLIAAIVEGERGQIGVLEVEFTDVAREGPITHMKVSYRHAENCWEHTFDTYSLTEPDVKHALNHCSLQFVRWVDGNARWLQAKPHINGIR